MSEPQHREVSIMGIININDDSFSGDGSLDEAVLLEMIREKVEAGADIIDLGAESARTNREAIPEAEEVTRFFSVLKHWEAVIQQLTPRDDKQTFPPVLSLNTWRPKVIKALLESEYAPSIGIINDMSALAFPETLASMKGSQARLLIMHSVGLPKENHSTQQWDAVVDAVDTFFQEKIKIAEEGGIPREQLILDPGLDFAKQTPHSLSLIKAAERFQRFDLPILYPLSRKNFIGESINVDAPAERDAGTVACLPFLSPLRRCILRVHNVEATYQATRVLGVLEVG